MKCTDPAETAQVKQLIRKPQQVFSCPAPGAVAGDSRNQSSHHEPTGVLQPLKAVAVHELILECPDHPLDHSVLLRALGRDEFLLQAVAFDQGPVAAARKEQVLVRPKQEWLGDPTQAAIAGDQCLLQSRLGRFGASTAAQVLAQQFPRVAVNNQRQMQFAILNRPNPTQVRRPALV